MRAALSRQNRAAFFAIPQAPRAMLPTLFCVSRFIFFDGPCFFSRRSGPDRRKTSSAHYLCSEPKRRAHEQQRQPQPQSGHKPRHHYIGINHFRKSVYFATMALTPRTTMHRPRNGSTVLSKMIPVSVITPALVPKLTQPPETNDHQTHTNHDAEKVQSHERRPGNHNLVSYHFI